MLKIRNLQANVEGKEILRGIDLDVRPGEVHAIMGPNGSGKSTLANVLAGRDQFEITGGSASWFGADLLELEPEERAREGIFLAFQYPVEIPGVSNVYLLKAALNARRRHRGEPELDAIDFLELLRGKMAAMQMVDVHLPTTDGRTVVLSRYTEPEADQVLLLRQLKMRLPAQPPPRITSRDVPGAV